MLSAGGCERTATNFGIVDLPTHMAARRRNDNNSFIISRACANIQAIFLYCTPLCSVHRQAQQHAVDGSDGWGISDCETHEKRGREKRKEEKRTTRIREHSLLVSRLGRSWRFFSNSRCSQIFFHETQEEIHMCVAHLPSEPDEYKQ